VDALAEVRFEDFVDDLVLGDPGQAGEVTTARKCRPSPVTVALAFGIAASMRAFSSSDVGTAAVSLDKVITPYRRSSSR
jgi:hypothetical protein